MSVNISEHLDPAKSPVIQYSNLCLKSQPLQFPGKIDYTYQKFGARNIWIC